MNESWQHLDYVMGMHLPTRFSSVLAQQPPIPVPVDGNILQSPLANNLSSIVLNLVGAIAILLLGWIIAGIVSGVVRSLLKRTGLDNRLSGMIGAQPGFNVEKVLAAIVFWIILILAVVAALNVLNLNTVSQPLNNFLTQIFAFLPQLGAAAVLIAVAWVVATVAKTVVIRTSQSFGLDARLADQSDGASPFLLSETLGNALYWFVFLFFLPLILGVLNLQGPLAPVQNLLNEILSALPNLVKAVIIGVVGWFVARTVRGIVTNLLHATGTDRVGERMGLSRSTGGQSLSWLIGTIVYVLILIPTATAALDALQIPSISAPATAMLNQVLNALPLIFTAVAILAIAYVIGKFVADLVTNILASIGFNNLFYWLGLQKAPYTPRVSPDRFDTEFQTGETLIQGADDKASVRSPSEIAGIVVLVGIMLFATVAATNVLNFQALTVLISGLLVIFGRILVGLAVFAVGLYLANLAFSIIASSGSRQAKLLAQTARIAIIGLVAAMALQQMGIAPNIVNLAFGLLLGAIAVAIAIAFGLGGRDVAAEQLRDWLKEFKQ
jgi:hypothetical protein